MNVILRRRKYGILLPVGIGHIAGTLLKDGYKLKIFDFALIESSKAFFKVLDNFKPDLIGMTIYNSSKTEAFSLATRIKEKMPNIPIVAGGAFISWYKSSLCDENTNVDYLIFGEGEITISELVDAILKKKSIKGIKGLSYKESGEWIDNEPRPFIENLDNVEPIPLQLFDYKTYIPAAGTFIRLPSIPQRCIKV